MVTEVLGFDNDSAAKVRVYSRFEARQKCLPGSRLTVDEFVLEQSSATVAVIQRFNLDGGRLFVWLQQQRHGRGGYSKRNRSRRELSCKAFARLLYCGESKAKETSREQFETTVPGCPVLRSHSTWNDERLPAGC